jgi:hypothetical protein
LGVGLGGAEGQAVGVVLAEADDGEAELGVEDAEEVDDAVLVGGC